VVDGAIHVNLLDTPGPPDFVGEVRAGLRAGDAALFVVSACDEIDEATKLLWRECAVVGMPRAVAVTKLEQARADFDETVARCQRAFGDAQPADIPLLSGRSLARLVNLLRRTVADYGDGTPDGPGAGRRGGGADRGAPGAVDGVDHRGVGGRGPARAAPQRR
jgi:elongation factor G